MVQTEEKKKIINQKKLVRKINQYFCMKLFNFDLVTLSEGRQIIKKAAAAAAK